MILLLYTYSVELLSAICLSVCMYMHVFMYVYMYVGMYICMYVCTCIHQSVGFKYGDLQWGGGRRVQTFCISMASAELGMVYESF